MEVEFYKLEKMEKQIMYCQSKYFYLIINYYI